MNFKLIFSIICTLSILTTVSNTHAYQITFQPRITVSTEYSDNFERTHEDEEEDIITTLSPGFAFSVIGQTQGLNLEYGPAYAWYQEHAEFNTLRHAGNLDIWKQASRDTRLYFNDAFNYTEDPGAEALDDETQDREGREPYYTNTATLGLSKQFGPSNIYTLEYNYLVLMNEDDAEQDSIENNPTAALTYYPFINLGTETFLSFRQGEFEVEDDEIPVSDDFENYYGSFRLIQRLSRTTNIFMGYSFTLMDYVEEEDDNYKLHYPNIGASYEIEDTISFNLSIGYLVTDRKVETGTLDDDERLQINADIRKAWQFRSASLNITGNSGYDESYFDQDNLGLRIFYNATASFNHEFMRDISYELNGGYRIDQYLNIDPEREDQTSSAGMGLIFSHIHFMTARLDYTYRDVMSDEEDDEYTENRISVSVTLTPRNPIYLNR
jgi:Putative beta-barrel porin 2